MRVLMTALALIVAFISATNGLDFTDISQGLLYLGMVVSYRNTRKERKMRIERVEFAAKVAYKALEEALALLEAKGMTKGEAIRMSDYIGAALATAKIE